jgi:hypothetical protein
VSGTLRVRTGAQEEYFDEKTRDKKSREIAPLKTAIRKCSAAKSPSRVATMQD